MDKKEDTTEEGYEPTEKEAPSPGIDSGIGTQESTATEKKAPKLEVSDSFRKPRHKGNGSNVVEMAKAAAERMKGAVAPNPEKPRVQPSKRQELTRQRDEIRMKAVRRFDGEFNDVLRFVVAVMIRNAGAVPSEENVNAVMTKILASKRFVGFYVDKRGSIRRRELRIDKAIAYTTGASALSIEERAVDWSNENPNLYDVIMSLVNAAMFASDIIAGETAAMVKSLPKADASMASGEADPSTVN